MCDCLSWQNPAWRAAARLARVQPDTVFAVFSALAVDGAAARRLRPAILAAGLGRRAHVIERILAALASLGVTCDGVVTPEWRPHPAETDETGRSTKPSAVRMRRKRERDRAVDEAADGPAPAQPAPPSPGVTCDAPPLLSYLSEEQSGKEQKTTRAVARGDDSDGFAELWALWPVQNRMADGERAYLKYLRRYSAARILEAARKYLADKPGWQTPRMLVHWLGSDPCLDPLLPLKAEPRVVDAEAGAPEVPRPNWIARLGQLKDGGVWRSEWGPPWGEPGCLVPPDTGVAFAIAAWVAKHPQYRETG